MTVPLQMAEALRRILDSQAAETHTALPGIVRSYDASKQTADIEPALLRPLPALDEDSEDPRERLPIIPSVPIAWPRAGGFFLHFPLAPGDSVLLVFSELDMNAWRQSGAVSDPGMGQRHGLSGAVAIPGLYPRPNPIGSASGSYGRIGEDGGAFVEFRPGEIRAGGSAAVAMAAAVNAELTKIGATLASLTGGGDAVPEFTAPYSRVDVDSTVLKGA